MEASTLGVLVKSVILPKVYYRNKLEKPYLGSTDYGFEMISSTLRFGKGVTSEVGYDVRNFKSKNPVVVTDKNIIDTKAFK